VRCSVLQCVAVCCSVLQCVAVCCNVLQCVAVCCSVLQCVAVCCSVLQSRVSTNYCVQREHGTPVYATYILLLLCLLHSNPSILSTGWLRRIRCFIRIIHLLQKSPIISGSFAKRDLHHQTFNTSLTPCILFPHLFFYFKFSCVCVCYI